MSLENEIERIKESLSKLSTVNQNAIQKIIAELESLKVGNGFEDDKIFLLSIEEYEKYKAKIPQINCWWWLRSPGEYSNYAAFNYMDGTLNDVGDVVNDYNNGVRPALRLDNNPYQIGDRFVKYDFPWIVIDNHLAIAEVPIAFRRFDEKSNDYKNSEIRFFLRWWEADRR